MAVSGIKESSYRLPKFVGWGGEFLKFRSLGKFPLERCLNKTLLLLLCLQQVCKVVRSSCLYVCLSVYSDISKPRFKRHKIFCTCYMWPWLDPLLMTMKYVMCFRFCAFLCLPANLSPLMSANALVCHGPVEGFSACSRRVHSPPRRGTDAGCLVTTVFLRLAADA